MISYDALEYFGEKKLLYYIFLDASDVATSYNSCKRDP